MVFSLMKLLKLFKISTLLNPIIIILIFRINYIKKCIKNNSISNYYAVKRDGYDHLVVEVITGKGLHSRNK